MFACCGICQKYVEHFENSWYSFSDTVCFWFVQSRERERLATEQLIAQQEEIRFQQLERSPRSPTQKSSPSALLRRPSLQKMMPLEQDPGSPGEILTSLQHALDVAISPTQGSPKSDFALVHNDSLSSVHEQLRSVKSVPGFIVLEAHVVSDTFCDASVPICFWCDIATSSRNTALLPPMPQLLCASAFSFCDPWKRWSDPCRIWPRSTAPPSILSLARSRRVVPALIPSTPDRVLNTADRPAI
jgi:hypothetical protein